MKIAVLSFMIAATAFIAQAQTTLTIYSARQEQLIKPLLDYYTMQTGNKTILHTDSAAALLKKILAEGANSPADILITVDAGNLWQAANDGVFTAVDSPILKANIPSYLRDPNNLWFGLSMRARTIVYNKSKVKPSELSTYQDLGNSKWAGKLCLRTSQNVYNQSLVATFISHYGASETMNIVKSWVANQAAAPFSNDNQVINAIANGQCDLGVVNTYYLGRLVNETPKLDVTVFWPDQSGHGVHVNASGAGVVKTSKNKAAAIKFLETMASDPAQKIFTDIDFEYPANNKIKPNPVIAAWGDFKPDYINVSEAGRLQKEAILLMDKLGYK